VAFDFSGGYTGSEGRIDFQAKLTNDGTKIARGVVVRGFLDDQQVWKAEPVDVSVEAAPVIMYVVLDRPGVSFLAAWLGAD